MTDEPIEDRVMMFKTDSPAQRHRIWQLRAELGLHEHSEWTDEKIAEEYVGASPDYVVEARERRATHGGTYVEKDAEPKPGLLARALERIRRGRARNDL